MNSFAEYIAHGFKLCAIPPGRKSPDYADWQRNPIPADAAEGIDGAGLLHALSGTCALDLDDMAKARPWLAERGIDIDALLNAPEAVGITSGRPGRAKLLYRLSKPLRTLKPKGSGLELRCATASGTSAQDVLPPSIHPDTKKPYEWRYGEPLLGDWRSLPAIPVALLSLWRELAGTSEAVEPAAPTEAQRVNVQLKALRKAAFNHSPDCDYDEWIKVGSQLHDGTEGAQEGFDIWAEWSRGIKRKPYPGDDSLMVHWRSFASTPGKRVATGAALVAELPAEADEFPIEPTEPAADVETTADQLRVAAQANRKAAIDRLEQRLVFVYSAERYFDTERHKLIGSDGAIEHMFTHMMPKTKAGRLSPVKVLKESNTKRFVDALGFHPGAGVIYQDGSDSYANTYRDRLPEPIEPTALEREKIEWLFDRIDDSLFREWLYAFFSHVVQKPGVKIHAAPLIWSERQGNGKTTLLRMIPSLLVGPNYSREVTCSLLNSDFNDYLLNAWHVNLTEFRAGTRGERTAISSKLKAWITDDSIAMHPKGSAAYTMPNHFFVTATSNEDDAALLDNNDRRWAVHEMHAEQFTEEEQRWIYNDFLLQPRAAAVLRHYFLNRDTSGFTPSAKAPETAARREMVEASFPADMDLLRTALEEHSEPLARDVVITQEVTQYIHKHSPTKPSAHRVGRMLAASPFHGLPIQFRVGQRSYRAIILRNHTRWRNAAGPEIFSHISGEDVDISA